MNAPAELKRLLCEQWCAAATVSDEPEGLRVALPMLEADGNELTVWLQQGLGGWNLTDHGTTLMRLAYSLDVGTLGEGQRARALERVLAEQGVELKDGALVATATEGDLAESLLRFGQAMTRAGDLRLWNKLRVASSFYEDLERELRIIVPGDRLRRQYQVPALPDADSYPVDFAVPDAPTPLYIFGVPSNDKARLTTIILQHLQAARVRFDSLVVPLDIDELAKSDRRRLLNAANDIVDSLGAQAAIRQKIERRLRA